MLLLDTKLELLICTIFSWKKSARESQGGPKNYSPSSEKLSSLSMSSRASPNITWYTHLHPLQSSNRFIGCSRIFYGGLIRTPRRRKTPLVAWKKLTQPWDQGGLGFIDFETHAQALLRKWATLFMALSKDFTWKQRCSINRAQYTIWDRTMLNFVQTCRSMTYAGNIWKAWAALRGQLLLSPADNELPLYWRIEDILKCPLTLCLHAVGDIKEYHTNLGEVGDH